VANALGAQFTGGDPVQLLVEHLDEIAESGFVAGAQPGEQFWNRNRHFSSRLLDFVC
jgi:hypothetical protein